MKSCQEILLRGPRKGLICGKTKSSNCSYHQQKKQKCNLSTKTDPIKKTIIPPQEDLPQYVFIYKCIYCFGTNVYAINYNGSIQYCNYCLTTYNAKSKKIVKAFSMIG